MKLVVIEWVDSALPKPEWESANDFTPSAPTPIFSVGFIVHGEDADTETVSLAPNVSNFGEEDCKVSGTIDIPRSAITAITDLAKSEPAKAESPPEAEEA